MNLFSRPRRSMPMIMQEANGECGLASLAMIANWLGHAIDMPFLRSRFPTSRFGLTFARVAEIASELGLSSRAFVADSVEELKQVRCPAILHWEGNHFVVLTSVSRGRFVIHNPAYGVRTLAAEDVKRHFTGSLLEIERGGDFAQIVSQKRLTIQRVFASVSGLKTSVTQIFCISGATAAISLVLPVLVQAALDDVIPRQDAGLLLALAVSYMAASAISALGDWYRQRILLNAGTSFVAQFTRNAVGHLFQLPLRYFESRHPADITVRLDSVDHIKNVVVQAVATSIVDAFVIVLAAGMMFLYAPVLGAIILFTLILVGGVRLLAFPYIARNGSIALKARSLERSNLIDNLRAIIPLRMGQALDRSNNRWFAALLRHLNAEFKLGLAEANLAFALHVIIALGVSVTLYLGVAAVIANKMTIGMLYAFFTFRSLFFERLESVVTSTIQVSMLSTNMARLRDFTEEPIEEIDQWRSAGRRPPAERLHIDKVTLRLGASDRPILSEVSLELNLRDHGLIGIVGPSGSGKSSLFKVMAGLYPPTGGSITVDGQNLRKFGLQRYRRSIGLLMGADKVFRGTVIQNVTGLESDPELEQVERCLRLACLFDDVAALPWELETVVSEENGMLSTGQRRRLMLARALYKRPTLLLADEMLSNLDALTGRKILENLAKLDCVVVVSAHSPDVIPGCSAYFLIRNGTLESLPSSDLHLAA